MRKTRGVAPVGEEPAVHDRSQVRKLYGISIGGITGERISNSFLSFLSIELGATYTQQSIVSSIRSLGNSILQGFWGAKSDKHGRKPYLALGYFAFLLGSLLYTVLWDIHLFILVLCVVMLLSSAIIPAWNGLLGDTASELERGEFLGKIRSAGSFFSVAGVVITGFLLDRQRKSGPSQYHLAFYLAFICFLLVFILVLALKEPLRSDGMAQDIDAPSLKAVFQTNRPFRRLLFVTAFQRFAMMAPQFAFPFVIKDVVHATNTQISILYAANMLSGALGERVGGTLSDRMGRKPILLFGRSLTGFVPLLMALSFFKPTWLLILTAFFLSGFNNGFGETMINTIVLDLAPPLQRGVYFGTMTMVAGVIGFVSALSFAAITQGIATIIGDLQALFIMLLVAGVLRFFAFIAHFVLPETSPEKRGHFDRL